MSAKDRVIKLGYCPLNNMNAWRDAWGNCIKCGRVHGREAQAQNNEHVREMRKENGPRILRKNTRLSAFTVRPAR